MKRDKHPSLKEVVQKSLTGKKNYYWVRRFTEDTFVKPGFAFVAGLYQQVKKNIRGKLSFVCQDLEEASFYEKLFYETFRELPSRIARPSSAKPSQRTISYSSNQVSEVVSGLTENNIHLPYDILKSRKRRVEYARGWLHRASVTYTARKLKSTGTKKKWPRVKVGPFTMKKTLAKEMRDLLFGLGIRAYHFRSWLYVTNRESLKRLQKLGLLSEKGLRKLEDILTEIENYWDFAIPVGDEWRGYRLSRETKAKLMRNRDLVRNVELAKRGELFFE